VIYFVEESLYEFSDVILQMILGSFANLKFLLLLVNQKNNGAPHLKGAVCDSPLFLGCSGIKTVSYNRTLKCVVLIPDMMN